MAKKTAQKEGVYVYIGPTIKGVIQQGSIYRGTRSGVLAKLSAVTEKYPKITRLIVADSEIMSAKQKIAAGGNPLSLAYRALQTGNN